MTELVLNLLLTGRSGVGKSTLIGRLHTRLLDYELRGFVSPAIEEDGERVGWRIDGIGGQGGVLAHIDFESRHAMGRYGVDVPLFERVVREELRPDPHAELYVIDEIGIIGGWSPLFVSSVDMLLGAPQPVIAIVRQQAEGHAHEVVARSDVDVWEMIFENRDAMLERVLSWVADRLGPAPHPI